MTTPTPQILQLTIVKLFQASRPTARGAVLQQGSYAGARRQRFLTLLPEIRYLHNALLDTHHSFSIHIYETRFDITNKKHFHYYSLCAWNELISMSRIQLKLFYISLPNSQHFQNAFNREYICIHFLQIYYKSIIV
jgi:hypothetical protein